MYRILTIEDNIQQRQTLKELLTEAGYDFCAIDNLEKFNVDELVSGIIKQNPNLILLDLNLPSTDGLTILQKLRTQTEIPTIILTGNNLETNEVLAMGFGADDYILKPYRSTILLLRISAVLRRAKNSGLSMIYNYKGTTIDLARGVIERNDTKRKPKAHLTKNEMIILRLLLENRSKIVKRGLLMEELWNNQEYINDNALTVNISRLREKFQKVGLGNCIETRKGLGYVLL